MNKMQISRNFDSNLSAYAKQNDECSMLNLKAYWFRVWSYTILGLTNMQLV